MERFYTFLFGMLAYPILEILWRGYTHITMAFAGGICFTAIYRIAVAFPDMNIFVSAALGSAAITLTELVFGFVFNIIAGLNVWDYSSRPCNFMGQICLEYTALWYALCVGLIPLCRLVHTNIIHAR